MSNLGGYQWVTTLIKSLGGPEAALKKAVAAASGLVVIGGAAGAAAVLGGQKAVKSFKAKLDKKNTPCPTQGQLFVVLSDGEDGDGLKLIAGVEYRVLECDGDAILIEVLDDGDNPYFVSGEFLATISDFPAEDPAQGQ